MLTWYGQLDLLRLAGRERTHDNTFPCAYL